MVHMYALFEHAAGYALFRVKEMEEIGMTIPSVEATVTDISKFNSIVKLIAFSPFKSGTNALDNMNSVSEGVMHEDLHLFLETNMPKPGEKKSAPLAVGDAKLGAACARRALGLPCTFTGIAPDRFRCIRYNFHHLVKGFTRETASKAQLGLGHSYSRGRVKFNVNRVDNMIIQAISLIDQLDKDINTFSMRIREWYSYHFPELVKIVNDNYLYAKIVRCIKDRMQLTDDIVASMEEILQDSAKAQAIMDASKSSMGMDISPIDLINIERFAGRVIALAEYRQTLQQYLISKMDACAPNLAALIGEMVGARLISHAGSLTNLAKYPASTVQILGAEKALFRALKTKGNTPKYGLIFHSSFIGRAGAKNKGRISRYLANKCSIASRIDCFSEIPTTVYGDMMKQQVEDRLTFYETGEAPRKNVDVMHEAVGKATEVAKKIAKKRKKMAKKQQNGVDAEEPTKKKVKKEKGVDVSMMDTSQEQATPAKKKKKKMGGDSTLDSSKLDETLSAKKSMKKKKKTLAA
ncbi:PREDICTED: nucleolar protein 56-like [Priapulus caudatus]|uniref:Nucleolar protein 56 n=1 Tax=Priapulus caudatus TaxID=37621 RepID=A0ABM1E9L4_PRICU|nr:PREDICTED: nucleolar protein 56-like [Priapulus caudatus]